MSDYISKQEAISAITQMIGEHYPYKTIFRAVRILHHVPTADVRENVKGKWLQDKHDEAGYGYFDCSVCGADFYDVYDFCPNCGADMRADMRGEV